MLSLQQSCLKLRPDPNDLRCLPLTLKVRTWLGIVHLLQKVSIVNNSELRLSRILFLAAAFWNLIGAAFGYFNTAYTFHNFFGRELTDPLIFAIYQGAWGTTLLYFIGYLIVAYNPAKHPGIVIVGGIGKVAFAVKLLQLYFAGLANAIVFIVVVGDFIFVALFLVYFYRLRKTNIGII